MSLWPHQERAAEWLVRQHAGVLDCPMGGGKTATAIEAAKRIQVHRVLVATRSANMADWPIEIARVWPEAEAVVLDKGTVAKKAKTAEDAWRRTPGPLFVVTNHESVWRPPLADTASKYALVIVDECHKVKSPTGKFSKWAAKALAGTRRWGLTGTLLPHSPLDAYAIGRALGEGVGYSYLGFERRFAVMGGYEGRQFLCLKDPDQFAAMLSKWVHRVTLEDMRSGFELPPAVHTRRTFSLSPEGLRAYNAVQEDVVREILGEKLRMQNPAIKLLRLQQATGGFLPLDGYPRQICHAKMEALRTVLEEEMPEEPAVVFFRFRDEIEAARRMCAQIKRPTFEVSGRCDEHRDWKATGHKAPVLLAQIQAAAEGISLVRARVAIYYSLGFELAQYEQSQKRVHRPGQDRPVVYVHLVADGTVDEAVYGALAKRKRIVDEVLSRLIPNQNHELTAH